MSGSSKFSDIIAGKVPGQTPNQRAQTSREWLRKEASELTNLKPRNIILGEKTALVNRVQVGSLYLFQYNPKLSKDLPYFDRFPIVFPFNILSDGFMGINLHYLPYYYRAAMMDSLYTLATSNTLDDKTRLMMSYRILQGFTGSRYVAPTIKRYLYSRVQSKFRFIASSEWEVAVFLPLERFQKASAQTVWRDSVKAIGRR